MMSNSTKAERTAAAQLLGRKGGQARAKKLSKARRVAIATYASEVAKAKRQHQKENPQE